MPVFVILLLWLWFQPGTRIGVYQIDHKDISLYNELQHTQASNTSTVDLLRELDIVLERGLCSFWMNACLLDLRKILLYMIRNPTGAEILQSHCQSACQIATQDQPGSFGSFCGGNCAIMSLLPGWLYQPTVKRTQHLSKWRSKL